MAEEKTFMKTSPETAGLRGSNPLPASLEEMAKELTATKAALEKTKSQLATALTMIRGQDLPYGGITIRIDAGLVPQLLTWAGQVNRYSGYMERSGNVDMRIDMLTSATFSKSDLAGFRRVVSHIMQGAVTTRPLLGSGLDTTKQ
jgi:hypothetical protein